MHFLAIRKNSISTIVFTFAASAFCLFWLMGVVSHIEHHDSVSVVWIWTWALQSTWIPLCVLVIRRLKGFYAGCREPVSNRLLFRQSKEYAKLSCYSWHWKEEERKKLSVFRWSRFKAWLATGIPRNCDTYNRIYQILVMKLMINLVPRILSFPSPGKRCSHISQNLGDDKT